MGKSDRRSVIVAGAGAFGGWAALHLQQSGYRVTLLDPHGPGNPLSSSGGESRVIRHVYRSRRYVRMTARSLEIWKRADRDWGERLFHEKGVLFMSRGGEFLDEAAHHMATEGVAFEWLQHDDLASRFPQIDTSGIQSALLEPGAGYLDAGRACKAVKNKFLAAGGSFLSTAAKPGPVRHGRMDGVALADGTVLRADQYLFACGPWLGSMFPGLLGDHLRVTRQEVYFFRTPEHCMQELNHDLPVWADVGRSLWYGIPGSDGTFKVADDARGIVVDPELQSREPTPSGICLLYTSDAADDRPRV